MNYKIKLSEFLLGANILQDAVGDTKMNSLQSSMSLILWVIGFCEFIMWTWAMNVNQVVLTQPLATRLGCGKLPDFCICKMMTVVTIPS